VVDRRGIKRLERFIMFSPTTTVVPELGMTILTN
jgi:hypothetical protein